MARRNRHKRQKSVSSSPAQSTPIIEPVWKWLPAFLAAAFVLRAAIALGGDFVIHADEIMQYLEPAHNLAFGSGVLYWEYFYGARSWLMPGLVAGVLWFCKIIGLGSPVYYIDAVKLLLCAISLLIPWGMYMFSRQHWGENSARIALLAGAFWYELAGMAHKPMTEFVATSLLCALLALAPLSSIRQWQRYAIAGALGALLVAVRFHYALAVALILLISFWHANNSARAALAGSALAVVAAVGILEWWSWGAPFHSYYFNLRANLLLGSGTSAELPIWQLPLWLLHASAGLVLVAVYGVAKNHRRRGLVLLLLLLVLVPHMLQSHKEYRFIFAVVPLWLMLFADVIAVAVEKLKRPVVFATAAAAFALVSVAGIVNAIPRLNNIYVSFDNPGTVHFIVDQDPIFDLYRRLGADPDVRGVADLTQYYHDTGGYYYLHHPVPFYDIHSWATLVERDPAAHVSHIITDQNTYANGWLQQHALHQYEVEMRAGETTLWKSKTAGAVREWQHYQLITAAVGKQIADIISGGTAPIPPPKYGIVFKDESAQ